jgi:hypothetical protein
MRRSPALHRNTEAGNTKGLSQLLKHMMIQVTRGRLFIYYNPPKSLTLGVLL